MPITVTGIDRARKLLKHLKLYIVQIRKVESEINIAINRAKLIHEGLEGLKLGGILVTYTIKGRARSSYLKFRRVFNFKGTIQPTGKVPSSATGRGKGKHLIATKNLKSRYVRAVIKCYAYRGFRTKTDKDSTQGRGIPKVMRQKRR